MEKILEGEIPLYVNLRIPSNRLISFWSCHVQNGTNDQTKRRFKLEIGKFRFLTKIKKLNFGVLFFWDYCNDIKVVLQ